MFLTCLEVFKPVLDVFCCFLKLSAVRPSSSLPRRKKPSYLYRDATGSCIVEIDMRSVTTVCAPLHALFVCGVHESRPVNRSGPSSPDRESASVQLEPMQSGLPIPRTKF